jgi:hypothetical protein
MYKIAAEPSIRGHQFTLGKVGNRSKAVSVTTEGEIAVQFRIWQALFFSFIILLESTKGKPDNCDKLPYILMK